MKNIVLFVATNLLLLSCTTIYKSGYSALPSVSIGVAPIVADLIIDTTAVLQGSSTTKVYFGIFKTGDSNFSDGYISAGPGSIEKSAATYNALDGTKKDVIVNPKYIVEIKNGLFVKTTTATVAGYGAKIKINTTKNKFE